MNEKELIEQHAKLSDELKAMAERAEKGELKPEDGARFGEVKTALIDAKTKLETYRAIKAAQGENAEYLKTPVQTLNHPGNGNGTSVLGTSPAGLSYIDADGLLTEEGRGLTIKQYNAMRSPDYKGAFKSYMRRAGMRDLMEGSAVKTLTEGLDTGGGYAVPEDFWARVIQKRPTPTRLNEFVMNVNTSTDRKIMPKVIYTTDNLYTTGMRVTWTGEVPSSATAARVTDSQFGQVSIPVYTALMSAPVTRDLLEDAAFDLDTWLADKFRETIELLYDNMIINGTGVNQPSGILINPGAANNPDVVFSGAAATWTADGIINTSFSLPEQYDENARWIMNKTKSAAYIATLKDGDGRYLWGQGLQDSGLAVGGLGNGQRMLNGYPVCFSGFMPNPAANSYPGIFGDLTGYIKVNRIGFTIQVLNELYAETNIVVLLGRIRFGGQLVEEWRMKIEQMHT